MDLAKISWRYTTLFVALLLNAITIGNFQNDILPALITWADFFLNIFEAVSLFAKNLFFPLVWSVEWIASILGFDFKVPEIIPNTLLMNFSFGFIVLRSSIMHIRKKEEEAELTEIFERRKVEKINELEVIKDREVNTEERIRSLETRISNLRTDKDQIDSKGDELADSIQPQEAEIFVLDEEIENIDQYIEIPKTWSIFSKNKFKTVENPEYRFLVNERKSLKKKLKRTKQKLIDSKDESDQNSLDIEKRTDELEQTHRTLLPIKDQLKKCKRELSSIDSKQIKSLPAEQQYEVEAKMSDMSKKRLKGLIPMVLASIVAGPMVNVFPLRQFESVKNSIGVPFYIAIVLALTSMIWLFHGLELGLVSFALIGYFAFLFFAVFDYLVTESFAKELSRDFWMSLFGGPILFLFALCINWQLLS